MKNHISYPVPLLEFGVQYTSGVQEGDNVEICLQTNWVVTESVHIHVETTHTTENTHAAIGKTNILNLYNKQRMCIWCSGNCRY